MAGILPSIRTMLPSYTVISILFSMPSTPWSCVFSIPCASVGENSPSAGKTITLPPRFCAIWNCRISRVPTPRNVMLLSANIPALSASSVVAVRMRRAVRLRSASRKSTLPNDGKWLTSQITTHSRHTSTPRISSVTATPIIPTITLPRMFPAIPPITSTTSSSANKACSTPTPGRCVSFGRRMIAGRIRFAVRIGRIPNTSVTTTPSPTPYSSASG